MHTLLGAAVAFAALFFDNAVAFPETSKQLYGYTGKHPEVITRDVAIIGGGSSGTYAAIRLRELNRTVAIIEQKNRLGGNTETYHDPATGGTVDIGVVVWHDLKIVRDYFAHFDVPLVKGNAAGGTNTTAIYADLTTGKTVAYTPSDPTAALQAYAEQLAKYPYLENGFDLPYPVPSDLLLPFGEFVRKYSLGAMVPTAFQFGQGLGDLLDLPTIYVMKNFGTGVIENIQNGFLTTKRSDNSEIYEKATKELGNDVHFNSTVLGVQRDHLVGGYITVRVKTPDGLKIIRAQKLLVTIPPKVDTLKPFDLDKKERDLFSQFRNTEYYTGILNGSGIPDDVGVNNASPNTPYELPVLPGVYQFSPTSIPGLQSVKFCSLTAITNERAKKDIIASVGRLRTAGTLATTPETTTFAAFSAHKPFELNVPAKAIEKGFYKKLYSLQGHRNVFYTGATWHTQDSSLLWQFTEALLPKIVATLR